MARSLESQLSEPFMSFARFLVNRKTYASVNSSQQALAAAGSRIIHWIAQTSLYGF
jgi:hypothetical protein